VKGSRTTADGSRDVGAPACPRIGHRKSASRMPFCLRTPQYHAPGVKIDSPRPMLRAPVPWLGWGWCLGSRSRLTTSRAHGKEPLPWPTSCEPPAAPSSRGESRNYDHVAYGGLAARIHPHTPRACRRHRSRVRGTAARRGTRSRRIPDYRDRSRCREGADTERGAVLHRRRLILRRGRTAPPRRASRNDRLRCASSSTR
jgi:hypothetical protein